MIYSRYSKEILVLFRKNQRRNDGYGNREDTIATEIR